MRTFLYAVLSLVVVCAASISPAIAERLTLSGEVTYRERIALPADAVLRVQLIDTAAAAGAPARVEARATISAAGQVPLLFTLNFDDRILEEGHSYALLAEISAGGAIWFRNVEPFAVDPRMPAPAIVIVTSFTGTLQRHAAPPPPAVPATPDILDVTWRAETIAGDPVLAQAETTLSIAADMRAGGRGGCNSYFAQAALAGESLRFSAVASTRMACTAAEVTAQEISFFEALAATRFWRLRDGKLVLLDAAGREVVVLAKSVR
jgi:putative lipoprotein